MEFKYLIEMLPFGTWFTGLLCWAAFILGNLIFTNRTATKMQSLPFMEYLLYAVAVMLGITFYNGVNQIYPNLWIAPVKFGDDCATWFIGAAILTPILALAQPLGGGESRLNGSGGGKLILKIINVFTFILLTGFFLTLGGRPQ